MNQERELERAFLAGWNAHETGLESAVDGPAVGFRMFLRGHNFGDEERGEDLTILALRSGGEGWQDISTAPKDGGAVDLYADGRRWTDFAWNAGLKRWERQEGYPATTRVLLIEPTHFMVALLPPPSIQGEG